MHSFCSSPYKAYSIVLLAVLESHEASGFPGAGSEARGLPPGFCAATAARFRPELLAATEELQGQRSERAGGWAPLPLLEVRGRGKQTHSYPLGSRAAVRSGPSGAVWTGPQGDLQCAYSKSNELLTPGTLGRLPRWCG